MFPEVVLLERLVVLPATPLHQDRRQDLGLEHEVAPCPAKIVRADVPPAFVSLVSCTLLSGSLDPPPKRPGRHAQHVLVWIEITGKGSDHSRDVSWHRRLSLFRPFPFGNPEEPLIRLVALYHVAGPNVHGLLSPTATASHERKADLAAGVVVVLGEEPIAFLLGQSDAATFGGVVGFELHDCLFEKPDSKTVRTGWIAVFAVRRDGDSV